MILATSLAFFLIIFLVGSILTAVAYLAFLKRKEEATEAEQVDPLASGQSEPVPDLEPGREIGLSPLLRAERLSSITFLDSVLTRLDLASLLSSHLEQAALNWSVGRVTSMMLLLGVIALAILMRFVPLWGALLGSVLAAAAPYNYILNRRKKRFLKFSENFPDVLDSLARALRAGYPLSAAMEMIAAETAPPVSFEMRRASREANLGRGWPVALENLGKRIPLLEVNMFIAAVQLHSRTGGKLSEVMVGLAENMRESLSLQGEVRALAAHGRMTGMILTILPIVIAGMMMSVSPGYMNALLAHPYGKNLIGAAIVCLLLAHFVIKKIVDIRV